MKPSDTPELNWLIAVRRRKPLNLAKAAVAKSIARCAYEALKHGEDNQADRWSRKIGDEMEQQA
ncbi:MAG TPA: hypothetical protein VFZ08_01855 [Terriglobia bacterium]|nr:hypothetical protein [Terriglobia bacterium]